MKVFIVYCHPSEDSFTAKVRDEFIKGLEEAGHSYVLSDLYKMNFKSEMGEEEYIRESYYLKDKEVPMDVKMEQEKIQRADAIAFIYPVFWSDVPAKLKGWFDRVYTCGYAYSPQESGCMKLLEKSIVFAITGKPFHELDKDGELKAMETIMLGDRIGYRAKSKQFVVLDGMSRAYMPARIGNWHRHLQSVYNIAKTI